MGKEMLGAKVAPRTLDRLEEYADKEGISKSEAADRMIKQGLDVQESDMRLVPVQADGGTVIEDELEHTQTKVDSLSREIEEFKSSTRRLTPSFLMGLAWIGLVSAFDLSSSVVVGTGIAVIGFLVWSYYRVMVRD